MHMHGEEVDRQEGLNRETRHSVREFFAMTGAIMAATSWRQPRERQTVHRTSILSGKAHAKRKKRNKIARQSRKRNR